MNVLTINKRKGIVLTPLRNSRIWLFCMLLIGTLLWLSPAQGAEIVTLSSHPEPDELAHAKNALELGDVVGMFNSTPQAFGGYFNVAVPQSKESRQHSARYKVLAAYRDSHGTTHTYVGPVASSRRSESSNWYVDFQKWAQSADMLEDSNSPDNAAWTPLSINTITSPPNPTDDPHGGNFFKETISVYRANSSNTQTDYYMITKQVDSQPVFVTCGWGAPCGYWTSDRWLYISTDIPAGPGYYLFDHGPLNQNNVTTAGFSVGAGVSGLEPNVSASYSKSWNGQDVGTFDTTNLTTNVASWHDHFSIDYSNPSAAATSLWESDQAAIYAVPVGTTSFHVLVNDQVNFLFDRGLWTDLYQTNINAQILVEPPAISVSPSPLKVVPGQHVAFNIAANIPASTGESLSWTISNIPNSISLNSTTGAGNQTISFDVPSNATAGLLGTLNVDTNPSYASPDVRTGPLQIPIVVISNSASAGVLITGGTDWNGQLLNTAEVWDPVKQTSKKVANMTDPRMFHTATPVANDQIFLAGGTDFGGVTNTTELFNEATQQFTVGPNLNQARWYHTATLLKDGTVLLAGGYDGNGNALSSAEIYDPVSNTATLTGSMSMARGRHTATLLADGHVLITGGSGSTTDYTGFGQAELYDPTSKTFSSTGNLNTGRQGHGATLLSNGQVLIVGGWNPFTNPVQTAELYTPATGQFTFTGSLPGGVREMAALTLPDGRAFTAGGYNFASLGSLYDPGPATFAWTNTSMSESRDYAAATLIQNSGTSYDGKVAVFGGVIDSTSPTQGTGIDVYDPSSGAWTQPGKMTTARFGLTATYFSGHVATSATNAAQ